MALANMPPCRSHAAGRLVYFHASMMGWLMYWCCWPYARMAFERMARCRDCGIRYGACFGCTYYRHAYCTYAFYDEMSAPSCLRWFTRGA